MADGNQRTCAPQVAGERRPRRLVFLVFAAIILARLLDPRSASADPELLLKTGDAAENGLRLSEIASVQPLDGGRLVFEASTSALLRVAGARIDKILTTGDPLPAPLHGSFNAVSDPAINDGGSIAFPSSLNSLDAEAAVFLSTPNGLTVIDTGSFTSLPAITAGGMVTYGSSREIRVWDVAGGPRTIVRRGRGSIEEVGIGGLRRLGRALAMNDAGVVAFAAETVAEEGIFVWSPGTGVTTVALDGDPSPLAGQPFDRVFRMNRSEPLILTGDSGVTFRARIPSETTVFVFRHDLTTGTTTLVDPPPEAPGSGNAAALGPDTDTPLGRGAEFGRQAVNGGGTVAVAATRRGLYTIADGPAAPLIMAGQSSPGTGFLRSVGPFVARAGAVVAVAEDAVGRLLLYSSGRGEPAKIVATGEPVRGKGKPEVNEVYDVALGGCASWFAESVAISPPWVALSTGLRDPTGGASREVLLRANMRTGSRTILALSGAPAPRGDAFLSFGPVALESRRTTFVASLTPVEPVDGESPVPQGIFVARGRKLSRVISTGDRAPGGGRFEYFGQLGTDRSAFAVAACVTRSEPPAADDGWCDNQGIFTGRRGSIRKLVATGDAAPGTGGGEIDPDGEFVLAHGRVVFSAGVGSGQGLFAWRDGQIQKIAASDDEVAPSLMLDRLDWSLQCGVPHPPLLAFRNRVAFLADTTSADGETSGDSIVLAGHEGRLRRVMGPDVPTLLRGLGYLDADSLVSLDRDGLVYAVDLDGASAQQAIFRHPLGE